MAFQAAESSKKARSSPSTRVRSGRATTATPPARSTSGNRQPMWLGYIDTTRLAMMAGIAAAVPGATVEDISGAVEDVAVEGRCDIVRPFVGHGIGTRMHEDLQVPNYRTGRPGAELDAGVCIAIEPMLALGSADVETLADGWTVVTKDHSLAAHFEHTIAVTENGPVILTTA